MKEVLVFLVGVLMGASIGVSIMALVVASKEDR